MAFALQKEALLFDLDNTVYDVPSVGHALFAPVFALLAESDLPAAQLPLIQQALMRQPYQVVARQYQFGPVLTRAGLELLHRLEYLGPLAPYPDWEAVRHLPGQHFLVTTGFARFQHSKIQALGVAGDFVEVHIVDLEQGQTKRAVFADILARHHFDPAQVLVVGDDPTSEIQAAQALGIDTVLYDHHARQALGQATYTITHHGQLAALLRPAVNQ